MAATENWKVTTFVFCELDYGNGLGLINNNLTKDVSDFINFEKKSERMIIPEVESESSRSL